MKNNCRPQVSVILPAYNAEDYLEEAIQSILDQTFEDFELIIINDKSTDSTGIILSSLTDPRIIIINNPTNNGITYSLNKAIEAAQGVYIARMDADDISTPKRLELQVNYLDNNPTITLLGCCAEIIDQNGVVFDLMEVPLSHKEIIQKIFSANCFIHPAVMFRASAIKELGCYNIDIAQAQDYDLWLRIIQKHRAANLPQNLIQYRVHPSQISQKKIKRQRFFADKARFGAMRLYQGKQHGFIPAIAKNSLLDRLIGKDLSVGSDYLEWITIYRKMGRDDLAMELLLPTFIAAPLSTQLYQQIIITFKKSKLINSMRWYKQKLISFIHKR
ncbi:MAG: glycosyltransferase [Porticoccaceae bacterium]|nr:glycosyltransferase [Porticoccaceae bacterium]